VRCRAGAVTRHGVRNGPGSAERHEECRTASGTRVQQAADITLHTIGTAIMKIIDLSRELYHRTPSYPGHPPIIHGVWKTHEESFADSGNVYGLSSMFISMADHGGTHIDAPRHFGKTGQPINEYPLENCIVPGICLDLRHIAARTEI